MTHIFSYILAFFSHDVVTGTYNVTNYDLTCQDPTYMRNYRWWTEVPVNTSCIVPMNETEVIWWVNIAASENTSIRAIGKSFSWSAVGMMETGDKPIYMVNMTDYMYDYTIDEDAKTITCQAGMRVIDVVEALQEKGLGLPDYGGYVFLLFLF